MYLITYVDRTNISVAAPAISKEFGLSKTAIGVAFSAFLWAYAIAQIPMGWLADRFGPRRVLLAIVPFWSAMTALTSRARGGASLISIRFVFGLGEAGAFPTATRAQWKPWNGGAVAIEADSGMGWLDAVREAVRGRLRAGPAPRTV